VQEPLIEQYLDYNYKGFNHFVNMAANTILKRKTIPSAQITTIVTPIKQEQIWIDGIKILL
jgi:hypothetical protein